MKKLHRNILLVAALAMLAFAQFARPAQASQLKPSDSGCNRYTGLLHLNDNSGNTVIRASQVKES